MRHEVGGRTYTSTLLLQVESSGELVASREVEKNGTTYAVCSPGTAFEVLAEYDSSGRGKGRGDEGRDEGDEYVRCTLYVDGKSVDYTFCFCQSATFTGWHGGGGTYKEFIFVAPEADQSAGRGAAAAAGSPNPQQGVLEVKFEHVREVPCEYQYQHGGGRRKGKSDGSSSCQMCEQHQKWFYGKGANCPSKLTRRVREDKKFFQEPSLGAATSGRVTKQLAYQKLCHYRTDHTFEPVVLQLRCETAATLSLRGILPLSDAQQQQQQQQQEHPGQVRGQDGVATRDDDEKPGGAGNDGLHPAVKGEKREAPSSSVERSHGIRGKRVKSERACVGDSAAGARSASGAACGGGAGFADGTSGAVAVAAVHGTGAGCLQQQSAPAAAAAVAGATRETAIVIGETRAVRANDDGVIDLSDCDDDDVEDDGVVEWTERRRPEVVALD